MVYPVTGPFTKAESALGPPNYYGFRPVWRDMRRNWYRQAKPYSLPLTFTYQLKQVTAFSVGYSIVDYSSASEALAFPDAGTATWFPNAYNQAHAKFVAKLKPDTAGLGVGLAQRKQAVDMIAMRAMQLVKFMRELKSFRLGAAAQTLGIDPKLLKQNKKIRRGSKNFANNFLEVHFGWSPLIGDIGSSVEILQKGVPPMKIKTSQKGASSFSYHVDAYYQGYDYAGEFACQWTIGCTVMVDNPNLFLANQLGFVNPALIAYDAVPFSFVLNWFVNIEQFLSSFTDMWGLAITSPYVTSHSVSTYHVKKYYQHLDPGDRTEPGTDTHYVTVETKRTPGNIPGPSLRIRNPWVVSPTRGLTAISLLVQKLRKP